MKRNTQILCMVLFLLFTGAGIPGIANKGIYHAKMSSLKAYTDTVAIELLHAKRPSIRLNSNTTREGIIFSNSIGDQPLEFYIFDLDGVLIHHTILNPKEKKTITALKKGIYLYDLFYKDESIERGKITIQ